MLQRLLKGIAAAGLPRHGRGKKLAELTGYSPTSVSEFLRGEKPLGERFIKLVCSELKLSYLWITTGRGEMFETKVSWALSSSVRSDDPVEAGYVTWFKSLSVEEMHRVYNQSTQSHFVPDCERRTGERRAPTLH